MSDQEIKGPPPPFDREFWLLWILVSTMGWVLGWALIGDVAVGATLGLGQWLVLRSRVQQAGWWIVATTVGWLVGSAILILVSPVEIIVLSGATLGAVLGVAQWLVLQRWVQRAHWWWPVTSILGWAVGPILGLELVGAVVGAVTGLTMELLLRLARSETQEAART